MTDETREASLIARKRTLRNTLIERRKSFAREEKRAADQTIIGLVESILASLDARRVFVYSATDDEVATRGLIDTLTRAGVQIAVPRLRDRETMAAVAFPGWHAMEPGKLGILSPPPNAPELPGIDAAIVPGLGFSRTGARLGFGAGYYDRWFAQHAPLAKIAVAYAWQIVDDLPEAAHDVAMDSIVTERGVLTPARGDAAGTD